MSGDVGDVKVWLPPVDELARRWPEVEPYLRRATIRTECYEPVDLLHLTMQGQMATWLVEVDGKLVAAMTVEAKQYPRRRVMEIVCGGGDGMKYWIKPLVAAIDEHARYLQCTHVATTGRPGWARAWGATPTGDVMLVREIWR